MVARHLDPVYEGVYGLVRAVCLVHLVRASMDGDIVKQSERLKTYNFDINPPETDIVE